MIKILAYPADDRGSGWYRIIQPYSELVRKYPKEFNLALTFDEPTIPDYQEADVFITHRVKVSQRESMLTSIVNAKANGCQVIYDLDDYELEIPSTWGMYWVYKWNDILKFVKASMVEADHLTVSTPSLISAYERFNDQISVFRNSISLDDPQWQLEKLESPYIRFGWAGGSSHYNDMVQLRGLSKALAEWNDRISMVICGYDTRGRTVVMQEDGTTKDEPLDPKNSDWDKMVEIFTEGCDQQTRVICGALGIREYGAHFTRFDIGLVPMAEMKFNLYKSELKVLELGMYKIPVIVSSVGIYSEVITHGETGFLVDPRKGFKHWLKYSKLLASDEQLRVQMGEKLHKLVLDKYDIYKNVDERAVLICKLLGREADFLVAEKV